MILLDWQGILTSALIAAIISSAVVLIGVVLTDLLSSKRVENKLSNHDERLISTEKIINDKNTNNQLISSSEHVKLSKEHGKLSNQHDIILNKLEDVHKLTFSSYMSISKGEETQKNRYENLSQTQREIHDSVTNIDQLLIDWEHVISKNISLQQDNKNLLEECKMLKSQVKNLEQQNNRLKHQIDMQQQEEHYKGHGISLER